MWQDSDITGGKVRLKHSSQAGETVGASGLVPGEVAINVADGKIFYKTNAGAVQSILLSGVTSDVTLTGPLGDYVLSFVNGVCVSISQVP